MIRSANLRPTLLKTPLSQTLTGAKRLASHNAPSWNQPSGYLFGERPVPKGQRRKWESWEAIYYVGLFGTLAAATVAYMYKPDSSIQSWALEEAKKRMEARGELPKYEPSKSDVVRPYSRD